MTMLKTASSNSPSFGRGEGSGKTSRDHVQGVCVEALGVENSRPDELAASPRCGSVDATLRPPGAIVWPQSDLEWRWHQNRKGNGRRTESAGGDPNR